ncbi:MAG: hypothetical protein RL205_926, partial [Actinomycetota bacterium]
MIRMRAAVLGSPISHSLSPVLHRAAYRALGLAWEYDAIEMLPAGMPDFLASLDDTWAGLSLTMPLKESVQPLLASLDDVARLTSSVNTVYRENGSWRGANTDVFGIVRSLADAGVHNPTSARLLGAGATARSAVAALRDLGVRSLVVCARRLEQAESVADLARHLGVDTRIEGLDPVPVDEDL